MPEKGDIPLPGKTLGLSVQRSIGKTDGGEYGEGPNSWKYSSGLIEGYYKAFRNRGSYHLGCQLADWPQVTMRGTPP